MYTFSDGHINICSLFVFKIFFDSDADGRVYDNYVDDDVNPPTPLFYFGSGLSFTTFAFAGIQVTDDGAGCT